MKEHSKKEINLASMAAWRLFAEGSEDLCDLESLSEFVVDVGGQNRMLLTQYWGYSDVHPLLNIIRSEKGKSLKRRWNNRGSHVKDADTLAQIDFLKDVLKLLSIESEGLLADKNLASTHTIRPGTFAHSSVSRSAGSHSGWSLHLTMGGHGTYNCIRRQHESKIGELVLLAPDAIYDFGLAENTDSWTYHWIYFQPVPRLLEWINWPELGPNIFNNKVPKDQLAIIENLFLSVQPLKTLTEDFDKALFVNAVEQILIRSQKYINKKQIVFRDTRVNDAKAFIMSNMRNSFSVSELADHLSVSRTQISVLFKRSTGQSILQWTNDRRMALAVQMLLQTDYSIRTIADEIGFKDALYFSRKFKASMGQSPRNYRKSQAKRLLE